MILKGLKAMLPIMLGVIPFGLVMGTVAASADLSLFQTMGMNFIIFAGASQLAAIDLMTQAAPIFVVVATGVIINLRFMLYSAAVSPYLKKSGFIVKSVTAYCLTDQSYAVLMAHESKLESSGDKLRFFFGTAICMVFVWHASVALGFMFGNFAPESLSLEFAIPLCLAAVAIPTLKNKDYIYVAMTGAVLSVLLNPLPYNLGLLISALLALSLGTFLTRSKA